jgi:hypothetical protein
MARKHEGKFILMVKYGTTIEGYPIGWYAARRCPEVKRGPNPKAALQSNMAEDLSLSADAHRGDISYAPAKTWAWGHQQNSES